MATKKPPFTLEEQTAKAKLRALAQGVQIWKLVIDLDSIGR